MPNIGPMELIIVLVLALIILGPKQLPDAGRSLGGGMREFKDSLTGGDASDRRLASETRPGSATHDRLGLEHEPHDPARRSSHHVHESAPPTHLDGTTTIACKAHDQQRRGQRLPFTPRGHVSTRRRGDRYPVEVPLSDSAYRARSARMLSAPAVALDDSVHG